MRLANRPTRIPPPRRNKPSARPELGIQQILRLLAKEAGVEYATASAWYMGLDVTLQPTVTKRLRSAVSVLNLPEPTSPEAA